MIEGLTTGRFAVAAVNEASDVGIRDDFTNGTHVAPRTKATAAWMPRLCGKSVLATQSCADYSFNCIQNHGPIGKDYFDVTIGNEAEEFGGLMVGEVNRNSGKVAFVIVDDWNAVPFADTFHWKGFEWMLE